MQRIMPCSREELAEFEPLFDILEESLGYVPSVIYAMARKPSLLRGFATLAAATLGPDRIETSLKHLLGLVASNASGCAYGQAHSGHAAHRSGASTEQIISVFEYETSPLFDDRERAALRFANDASQPSGDCVTARHYEDLRKHFHEEEVLEILSVISLYGYLNRWNRASATRLEEPPRRWAENVLAPHGWHPGRHR